MKKVIKKLFNLQGLWIDSTDWKENGVILKVRSPRNTAKCPFCGKSTKLIHQKRERKIKHGIYMGKIVYLLIKVRRFYCKKCKKTFREEIPIIDRKRISKEFRKTAILELKTQSFNEVSKKLKVSSNTLTRVLKEGLKNYQIDWKNFGEEIYLGVDEHSFRGKNLLITITELKKQKLLAILPDDRQKTLDEFFSKIPEEIKPKIKGCCIDLKISYKNAIKKHFPKTQIVVDKFHLVKLANQSMEEIRRIIFSSTKRQPRVRRIMLKGKEKISSIEELKLKQIFETFSDFPDLKASYIIKERIREMYQMNSIEAARKHLKITILLLEESNSYYLQSLKRTLKRWRKEILNYFLLPITNAFTEGCHTKIKMVKRVSFGFKNVYNYIGKIMLAFLPFFEIFYHHF